MRPVLDPPLVKEPPNRAPRSQEALMRRKSKDRVERPPFKATIAEDKPPPPYKLPAVLIF